MEKTTNPRFDTLLDELAAHPKWPWGHGLVLSGGTTVVDAHNDAHLRECRVVYDSDEHEACDTTAMLMRTTYALLPNHPTTLGWVIDTLTEAWALTGHTVWAVPVPEGGWKVLVQHFGKNTARFRGGSGETQVEAWVDALLRKWKGDE